MASVKVLGLLSAGAVLTAVSIVAVAGPASKSPFATKKPKAWETGSTPATPKPAPAWQQQAQPQNAPQYQQPSYKPTPRPAQVTQPQNQTQNMAGGSYYPGKKPAWQTPQVQRPQVQGPQISGPQVQGPNIQRPNVRGPNVQSPYTSSTNKVPAWANKTYDARRKNQTTGSTNNGYQPAYKGIPGAGQNIGQNSGQTQPAYASNYGAQNYGAQNYPQTNAANAAPALRGASKPTWLQRLGSGLGFGNVETSISGHAKVGVAAMDRNGADVTAESIVDLDVRGEVSAITDGGLEYGAGLRVRAQRDRHRRGFGGRVGDCPAIDPACTGVRFGAVTRSVKGHTGQFYTGGNNDRRETEVALEGAYLFLRSAYGDLVVGRDDGSAYLFSVGAPSLVAVNASNSSVDYTGLDSVKTFNDASGFAEKIAYTSPRLLGDTVGVGVQIGLSYAPNARACGVDYCVKSNTDRSLAANALDPFAPEIKNIFEVGVALDRKFDNGFSAELTGTYARGSDDSGLAIFDDLESYGLGLELKYADFIFGTSYLNSNNGFAGQGDYTAYDAGITWKPSNWGLTASYGHADDDIAHLTSDQAVLAFSYDLGKVRLGTGVQYISRNVPIITASGRNARKEDAAALFIEAGVEF